MLTDDALERILLRIPELSIAVIGDLFLDRYLDIDAALTEPSVETGLEAYQVTRVRSYPGAAGTVINNLAALGVGTIHVIAVIGDDGEGHELRQALARMPAVRAEKLITHPDRRTPTYTKPMLCHAGEQPRELNRLDIKNRLPLHAAAEAEVAKAIDAVISKVHAVIVVDQVSEAECGVVTSSVRARLAGLGRVEPARPMLADSREHIGLFTHMMLKANAVECQRAVAAAPDTSAAAAELSRRCGRTVFCTCGERGTLVADPTGGAPVLVSAYHVAGPIDPVGAGDSTSAAIACALAANVTAVEAAGFGNLVASITIQQLGTTGTASPPQIRQRWQAVRLAC